MLAGRLSIPLAGNGRLPPFFAVPAAGSIPFSLVRLARMLNRERPVFGFMFAGMENSRAPHNCIEEMASAYLEEVKALQPSGPYYLGGHCFGGTVAYEMAVQLEAAGDSVAVLVPMESLTPSRELAGGADGTGKHADSSETTNEEEDAIAEIHERIGEQLLRIPDRFAERFKELTNRQLAMDRDYRATPIEAPIAQLRSSTHPARAFAGWKYLSNCGYSERIVPGDTYSILALPHVTALAAELEDLLNRFL